MGEKVCMCVCGVCVVCVRVCVVCVCVCAGEVPLDKLHPNILHLFACA